MTLHALKGRLARLNAVVRGRNATRDSAAEIAAYHEWQGALVEWLRVVEKGKPMPPAPVPSELALRVIGRPTTEDALEALRRAVPGSRP
jgi:hypothetical protein